MGISVLKPAPPNTVLSSKLRSIAYLEGPSWRSQPPFDWQMLSPWMPYTLTSVSFSSDLILLFR
jgi:hypothetical protein